MKRKWLFGSHNPAKVARIKAIINRLPIELASLSQLGIMAEAEENSSDVMENAIQKAKFYYRLAQMPTFAIDSGLYIDRFPPDKQPGAFVRRWKGKKLTDEELIRYFSQELQKVGGQSKGRWISAIAFVWGENQIRVFQLVEERLFVSQPSPVRKEGLPLSSLAIDVNLGKYISELSDEERKSLQANGDQRIYEIFCEMQKVLDDAS